MVCILGIEQQDCKYYTNINLIGVPYLFSVNIVKFIIDPIGVYITVLTPYKH
jgi:hypothetical protein